MTTSESTDWERLHRDAILVDLHAHPSLKSGVFKRGLSGRIWTPAGLRGAMNPLSVRTSFENLNAGGVDVLMATAYPPEHRLLEEITAFKLIPLKYIRYLPISFARRLWREFVEPPYFDVAISMIEGIDEQVEIYNNRRRVSGQRRAIVARTADELKEIVEQGPDGPIAIVHSVEGAHSLEGAVSRQYEGQPWESLSAAVQGQIEAEVMSNLDELFGRGVAYIILAHFFPNRLVAPVFPFPEHVALSSVKEKNIVQLLDDLKPTMGLTDLGRKVVGRMMELGMIIDLSHSTPLARSQVYQMVEASQRKAPIVMANHVGAYALNPSPYNLEDWEIRWIGGHGGVIGVIFMSYWLFPSERHFGIDFISRHIEYIAGVGSEEVVALGTDFDGADPPDDLATSAEMARITLRLMTEFRSSTERKYTDEQIQKFLGDNAYRFLQAAWGKT